MVGIIYHPISVSRTVTRFHYNILFYLYIIIVCYIPIPTYYINNTILQKKNIAINTESSLSHLWMFASTPIFKILNFKEGLALTGICCSRKTNVSCHSNWIAVGRICLRLLGIVLITIFCIGAVKNDFSKFVFWRGVKKKRIFVYLCMRCCHQLQKIKKVTIIVICIILDMYLM